MDGPPLGTELSTATRRDAAELLVLQRCCWVTEAIVNDTLDIPPLHEDLDTVRGWIESMSVWLLRLDGRLVGAVRARRAGVRWEIGRLMVAPDLTARGIGRWLLAHAEAHAPAGVTRIDLFTGAASARNLRMYDRAGYRPVGDVDDPAAHIAGAVALTKPTRSSRDIEGPAG